MLTYEQTKVIESQAKHLLVSARAGTGKTFTLVNRIKNNVRQNDKILFFTFSRGAREEMESRVNQLSFDCDFTINVETFHSFALRELLNSVEFSGFTVITNSNKKAKLMEKTKETFGFAESMSLERVSKFKNSYDYLFPELFESKLKHAEDFEFSEWEVKFVEKYNFLLREKKLLEFDDMVPELYYKLKNPDRDLFSYGFFDKAEIFVDEFQDTNFQQYEFLKRIFSLNEENNIICVGDPNQSIYEFRGAVPEVFDMFKEDFENTVELFLTKNFRSTPDIEWYADKYIISNGLYGGTVKAIEDKIKLSGVNLVATENRFEEAEFVASDIKTKYETSINEVYCILVRERRDATALINALKDKGIEFNSEFESTIKGNNTLIGNLLLQSFVYFISFLKTPDINDYSGYDVLALAAMAVPGIGKRTVERIRKASEALKMTNIKELLEFIGENLKLLKTQGIITIQKPKVDRLLKFMHQIYEFANAGDFSFNSIFSFLYNVILDEADITMDIKNEFFKNMEKFTKLDSNDLNIDEILNHYEVFEYEKDKDASRKILSNKVIISTIHGSKGLEYDHVYLLKAQGNDRSFDQSQVVEQVIAEEKRIYYVAITRAKQSLTIVYQTNATTDVEDNYNSNDQTNLLKVFETLSLESLSELSRGKPIKIKKLDQYIKYAFPRGRFPDEAFSRSHRCDFFNESFVVGSKYSCGKQGEIIKEINTTNGKFERRLETMDIFNIFEGFAKSINNIENIINSIDQLADTIGVGELSYEKSIDKIAEKVSKSFSDPDSLIDSLLGKADKEAGKITASEDFVEVESNMPDYKKILGNLMDSDKLLDFESRFNKLLSKVDKLSKYFDLSDITIDYYEYVYYADDTLDDLGSSFVEVMEPWFHNKPHERLNVQDLLESGALTPKAYRAIMREQKMTEYLSLKEAEVE